MTRIERKLLLQNTVLGVSITLLILAADWRGEDGLLAPLERSLYDQRATQCQFFTPEPSDALLHVDIDDQSLQQIGAWPWRRTLLADMTRVLHEAGARTIAFDVMFTEPQEVDYVPQRIDEVAQSGDAAGNAAGNAAGDAAGDAREADAGANANPPAAQQISGTFQRVDDNANFAAAIQACGSVMIPLSLREQTTRAGLEAVVIEILVDDMSRTVADVRAALNDRGATPPEPQVLNELYSRVRPLAMYRLIRRALDRAGEPLPDKAALREMLWADGAWPAERAFPVAMFDEQHRKAVAVHHLRRFSRAKPADVNLPLIMPTKVELAPIPELSTAMAATSFVDYLPDPDGVVRSVTLWREHNGRLYPQFGLMLACAYLGVDINDITLLPDRMILPAPDGDIVVPVYTTHVESAGAECGMIMLVPWFGSNEWLTMYDPPLHMNPSQHIPIVKVWESINLEKKLRENAKSFDDAWLFALRGATSGPDLHAMLKELEQNPIKLNDWARREAMLKDVLKKKDDADWLMAGALTMSPEELNKHLASLPTADAAFIQRQVNTWNRLPSLFEECRRVQQLLDENNAFLRNVCEDKAIVIGWTAVGRQDVLTTPIHAVCPGVVGHGVIFNGIVGGEMWTRASPWVTRGVTLLVGLLATLAAAWLNPLKALVASVLMAALYVTINGVVLFDQHNLIVGAAAPLVAIALIWSACTLVRFIVEKAERARITDRFRSYVDPALVNYVIEHPEQARLDGQVREMTVVFTDLEGFTTLSEELEERTVRLLNEFMGRMVKIIRDENKPIHRRAIVNKFLGDGIMFFFGAPHDNESHALDAVSTVLRMQEAMVPFNESLAAKDLPGVRMRVGVATGRMVVGDAGSEDASDYTVLGNVVNLSSRLEGANKSTGTYVLINDRNAEVVSDAFLCRPIAKLQVVGQSTGAIAYEPLCYRDGADAKHVQLAEQTTAIVEAFIEGDFGKCIAAIDAFEKVNGVTRLSALYRGECHRLMSNPLPVDFDGTIVLTSK